MTAAQLYLLIAVLLVGTELLILQFTVFWFLFFGLGALATSAICFFNPQLSWAMATIIFLVASIVVSIGLYPMLKKWQNKPSELAGHDAIGQTGVVVKTISALQQGTVQWSGSQWPAELLASESGEIGVGETVTIRQLEGIRLIVSRS